MIRKLTPKLISLLLTVIILVNVLKGPSNFNLVPYTLYHYLEQNGHQETNFIRVFDILIGLVIFFFTLKVFEKLWDVLVQVDSQSGGPNKFYKKGKNNLD